MQTDTSNISSVTKEKAAQPQTRKSGTRKASAKQSTAKAKAPSKQAKVLALLHAPAWHHHRRHGKSHQVAATFGSRLHRRVSRPGARRRCRGHHRQGASGPPRDQSTCGRRHPASDPRRSRRDPSQPARRNAQARDDKTIKRHQERQGKVGRSHHSRAVDQATHETRARHCLAGGGGARRNQAIKAARRAKLIASIAKGRRWLDELVSGLTKNPEQIAERERCSVRKVNMTISLAFLAPDLVKAAVDGTLPRGITLSRLYEPRSEWREQSRTLGLA